MDSDAFIFQHIDFFNGITLSAPTMGAIFTLVLAIILLGCSGFMSASEIAFFSLSPQHLNTIEEQKNLSDKKIIQLRQDSERLLATILITNNFVNVAIIMLFNYFFSCIIDFGASALMEFLFMTVVLTFLLLLFGEIMPKIYSSQHVVAFCRIVAPALVVLEKICWPISSILLRSKKLTNKVIKKENGTISVDVLEHALELTDNKDIEEERNMLEGIIRFGGEMAKEIMTPRVDIADLEMKTPYPEVLKCIVENNYSRIPVYSNSKDNMKGVLYIKDLLPHLNKPANFRWQSLIRPPYFVPETKMIDDLLRDFQTNKVHIAIVVDEFGGTSGIVTMEDIIEEIVGEINDEYDDEERLFVKLNANTYIFEAKILLSDFIKIMKVEDDLFKGVPGDADTLAGLLLELKSDFPKLHEVINYKNYSFEVLEMDDRRIMKIKLTLVHNQE